MSQDKEIINVKIHKQIFIDEISELLTSINIHGHINHRNPKERKRVVSRIDKETAETIVEGIYGYLTAYEED